MARLVQSYDRVLASVSRSFGFLAALIIGVVGIIIVADIVGRVFFDFPIRGVVEVAKLSIVAITFLALPIGMRRSAHIRSTVLVSQLPQGVQRAFLVAANGLAAVLFALIAYASWSPMLRAWRTGDFEGAGALRVPTAPTKTVIVVASIVMVLESISAVRRVYRSRDPELDSGAELVS